MSFKRKFGAALCAALLLVAGCGADKNATAPASTQSKAYLTVVDAAKRTVTLEQKPQRVVSLSPSYLGMIEAVGGSIVGRTTSKIGDIPASMQNVPEVGMVYNVNMEALVGLKPDLVLAGKNQHDKFVPLLESNKIKVLEYEVRTYDDVKNIVKVLGDVYGHAEKAEAKNTALDKEVEAVLTKMPKEKKRIAIMHATASSVTVAGSRSIAGCVSDILGFENVPAKALQGKSEKTPYSMESLVEQDPEIIFITSMGKADEIENRLKMDFKNNPAWNSLGAVKSGKVYALPEKLFLLNPGLEYPKAIKYMAQKVYPEVFKDGE